MTLRDWTQDARTDIRNLGIRRGTLKSVYELVIGGIRRWGPDYGISPFDLEWDLYVILDACRPDLMGEVADEYDFIGEVQSVYSNSSTSKVWMERNLRDTPATDDLAYVSGNPFTGKIPLREREFCVLDEVWRYAWDEDIGTIHPRPLTERVVTHAREGMCDRLMVHYMQPHFPFIPHPDIAGRIVPEDMTNQRTETKLWQLMEKDDIDHSREKVWEAYRDNLRVVLDEVGVLLDNVDAERVVISADHGNAFGEWTKYGHGDMPLPCVKRVPLVETTAEDDGTLEPSLEPSEAGDSTVDERLDNLGYK